MKPVTREKQHIAIFFNKFFHLAVTVIAFYAFWLMFRYGAVSGMDRYGFRYNYFVAGGYGALIFLFSRTYNAYLLGYSRIRTLAFAQFISQIFSLIIIYIIVSIGWNHWHNPSIFLLYLLFAFFFDIIWSFQANGFYFRLNPIRKTLLIYRNELDRKRISSIRGKPSERLYKIVKEVQYTGDSFSEIKPLLEGYDAVFVAGVYSRCRNGILKYCTDNHIPGFFLPHVGDVLMQGAAHIQSFDSPILFVDRKEIKPEYAFAKRAFDIMASLCGIILLSPIMLLTALAIRLYDHGPAIYQQTRLTKDGKRFQIYKFRSMRIDAEKDGVARLSTGDKDDRITPIGHFVRKCRLDELPQLFNILKGDMTIVGPRPERPEIAEQYYRTIPDFSLRLQVKAGLTGYAQVYGKYNTDPYEKLEFDLLYINNMSMLTDLKLMFATFNVLFSKESTSGVAEGQTTAVGENYSMPGFEKPNFSRHDNE